MIYYHFNIPTEGPFRCADTHIIIIKRNISLGSIFYVVVSLLDVKDMGNSTLVVRKLSKYVSNKDLRKVFPKSTAVKIPKNWKDGKSKGYVLSVICVLVFFIIILLKLNLVGHYDVST